MYHVDEIIGHLGTPGMELIVAVLFAVGFGQYGYSFLVQRSEKKSPFPVWMHAFYLGHDFCWVALFPVWFYHYNFWLFKVIWFGMVAFNVFELYSLRLAVIHERQEAFGAYYDAPVTVRQAVTRIAVIAASSAIIVMTLRSFLGDTLLFSWFLITNIIMAVAPGMLVNERRSRSGGSVGLALLIVAGTAFSFMPPGIGFWTTMDPEYYSRPWFYVIGAVSVGFACRHLVLLLRLPGKPRIPGRLFIY